MPSSPAAELEALGRQRAGGEQERQAPAPGAPAFRIERERSRESGALAGGWREEGAGASCREPAAARAVPPHGLSPSRSSAYQLPLPGLPEDPGRLRLPLRLLPRAAGARRLGQPGPRRGRCGAARALEASGYREMVLTGVNISAYRPAARPGWPSCWSALLAATAEVAPAPVLAGAGDGRPELAAALGHPRVCPHFHLPVQSGSDRGPAGHAAPLPKRTRCAGPRASCGGSGREPFLAADLIAGFPGETEEDFRATYALVEDLAFAKLHVFPFSPRPGTAARIWGAGCRNGCATSACGR